MDYQKIYNQIIERAKTRQLEGYKEKHHILPKCIGGLDVKENLVELTAREHFLCHKLLCKIYPNEYKLWYALWLMVIGKQKNKLNIFKINNRDYERLKKEFIDKIKGISKPGVSLAQKGIKNSKKTGPPKGHNKHDGFGALISKAKKGKKRPNFIVTEKMLACRRKPRKGNPRKVVKLDINTFEILEIYSNLKEAEKIYKGIKNALRIDFKIYKDGYWSYLDKEGKIVNNNYKLIK